jgi:aspartate/methionine/tyrosine aminotransferase
MRQHLKQHAIHIKTTLTSPSDGPFSPTHEDHSEAHQLFRSVEGHATRHGRNRSQATNLKPATPQVGHPDAALDSIQAAASAEPTSLPGMLPPGATGVIYVMDRAMAQGFSYTSPEWANFGQGAPEVGPIPGASDKPKIIDLEAMGEDVHEYAPTTGVRELREAVANLYNVEYRDGKESKYTYENVCIVPGGRAGLTRVASVIGDCLVGYQVPEYTAYDQMLSTFRRIVPIPTALKASNSYRLSIPQLKDNIHDMGLSVIFASNPRNPTGQAVEGEELKELVSVGREGQTIVLDEFYSAYNLEAAGTDREGESLSAARYIKDVNTDAVVLIDGLTKNFRCPGWRVCWVIGPKSLISALSQSGSFLDGGASHPMQVAAIPLLEPSRFMQDKKALQRHFRMKRDHVLKRLEAMGLPVKVPPQWTFYIWLDLSELPPPLNAGLVFMEELLKEKTIVVPGLFFDINPAHRRNLFSSPTHHFVRLSFGPPLEQLDKGLDGIERVLKKAREHLDEKGHLGEMGRDLAPHESRAGLHGVADRGTKAQ